MKTISLKPTGIKRGDFFRSQLNQMPPGKAEEDVSVREMIEAMLNSTPEGGFSRSVLRERQRVEDAMDNAASDAESFDLEDQDAKTLKSLLDAPGWSSRSKALLRFLDRLDEELT